MSQSPRINDFSIHVATVNGSGSQSSNNILMRSIFRMGVPVSGKNLFPSNIQGLPTWFTIRVNKDGWTARVVENDILVCMNDQTYTDDVRELPTGSVVIHHDHMNVSAIRSDLRSIPVPFSKIIAEACPDARLRKLAVNMVYVGILAELLGITDEAIELAMKQQFKGKEKAIDLNRTAMKAGRVFAQTTVQRNDFPFKVEPLQMTKGKIMIEGNNATALGAIFAGCSVVSWYPITPSSSVVEYFSEHAEKFRVDPQTKLKNVAVIQAEDELAAAGMVLGASWMGARAMTATSGPGISLMAEFVGFSYFAEVPAVIVDVQRVGPSTGLPTRTMQGDVLFAATLSHGDTKNICVYPGTVEECYTLMMKCFDLSERFQTTVFFMSELDLGMNIYMTDPFPYIEEKADRGKVLTADDKEKLQSFYRYTDVDKDGICYRTLPGLQDPKGTYFTRGSGHNAKGVYSERGSDYKEIMDRLNKKWETARTYVPDAILTGSGKNKIGIIAYGSSHDPVREAVHLLKKEENLDVDYLRIRAYPFTANVKRFIETHEEIYVVEQNRDAQMLSLLKMEKDYLPHLTKLESLLHYDGLPLHARFIVKEFNRLKTERAQTRKTA